MGVKPQHRPVFEKVRKECNIIFADECRRGEWPAGHRSVFEAIERLKSFTYDTYRVGPTDDNLKTTAAWKVDTMRRARKLGEKARDLVARNEATWRLACEPLVFDRLNAEIACTICRNRVWRSEIEASGDDTWGINNLRLRQEKRQICHCLTAPYLLADEDEMAGLDRLFIDRAEDWVTHPLELSQRLPQEQRPDRVYGLRQTKNIERLLEKKLSDGSLLEHLLPNQPHDATLGQPLLFPFLVVEAKAGNSPDDWHSIRLQTAFPIFTYLNTQRSLCMATGARSRWLAGPLVWFFTSRGEDWRLSLAYQSRTKGYGSRGSSASDFTTHIVQVWAGSITNRDDALRLLLIVDYMSDWARDIYRTTVITELRVLANPDTDVSTIFADTDIFSSGRSHPDGVAGDKARAFSYDPADAQAAFKALDSDVGAVRVTAWLESRFRALVITEANVQRLTNSIREDFRAPFVRQILNQFYSPDADPVALTPQDLADLETAWTSHARQLNPIDSGAEDTTLYIAYVVLYYLLPSWDQVRELCVVSISKRALDILVADFLPEAKGRAPTSQWRGASYLETGRLVLDTVEKLRSRVDSQENLLACIYRLCCRFRWAELDPEYYYHQWSYRSCTAAIWEVTAYADLDIVDTAGELENGLPYLFTSSRSELQPSNSSPPTRFLCPGNPVLVSLSGAIFIHSDATAGSEQNSPSLCVYLVQNSAEKLVAPSQDELRDFIHEALENCPVYHTTCFSSTLDSWPPDRPQDVWNLEQFYGISFLCGENTFFQWLQRLGNTRPVRRRYPPDVYRSIFSQEEVFYHRFTCRCGARSIRMSEKFVRQLRIAEATAWVTRAHQLKTRAGWIRRCVLCCRLQGDGRLPTLENKDDQVPELCSFCWSFLSDHDSWEIQAIREGFQNVVSSIAPDIPERPHLANKTCFSNPSRRLSRLIASLDITRESRNPNGGENLRLESGTHNNKAIPLDPEEISEVFQRPDSHMHGFHELSPFGTNPMSEAILAGTMNYPTELDLPSEPTKGTSAGKRKRSLIDSQEDVDDEGFGPMR
ncbi:hypothetical protein B0J18DRAFT_439869 [Chaetomium sp. MPI-SDFR-AT-0129]|nr:hypothetical protein B0J18DRAFT_439869 [Chaetomium sp. MPI-SDFR-AT-0129]